MKLNQQPIPYDCRLNRTLRHQHETVELDRRAARIALETSTTLPTIHTLGADPSRGDELRGIPAIGLGVRGAIAGSVPGAGLKDVA